MADIAIYGSAALAPFTAAASLELVEQHSITATAALGAFTVSATLDYVPATSLRVATGLGPFTATATVDSGTTVPAPDELWVRDARLVTAWRLVAAEAPGVVYAVMRTGLAVISYSSRSRITVLAHRETGAAPVSAIAVGGGAVYALVAPTDGTPPRLEVLDPVTLATRQSVTLPATQGTGFLAWQADAEFGNFLVLPSATAGGVEIRNATTLALLARQETGLRKVCAAHVARRTDRERGDTVAIQQRVWQIVAIEERATA